MEAIRYDYLSDDAKFIRQEVFMKEQGFQNEFDEIDDGAMLIVLYDEKRPVATCRVFEGEKEHEFVIGRLAVIKDYRGMNLGTRMLDEAEKVVRKQNGVCIMLHAQCRVKKFYEQSGYVEFGEIQCDEGCPHIWMKKMLVK